MAVLENYKAFVSECEEFCTEFNLSEGYFGIVAARNGRLLQRLRDGGRVFPETMKEAREYMAMRRKKDAGKKQGGE